MYDPRLSDEENNSRHKLQMEARRHYRSEDGYAQRCRDNRNFTTGMWKVLGCIALGCIALGAAIGAVPGGFTLALLFLLAGLLIDFIGCFFPEDYTGIL